METRVQIEYQQQVSRLEHWAKRLKSAELSSVMVSSVANQTGSISSYSCRKGLCLWMMLPTGRHSHRRIDSELLYLVHKFVPNQPQSQNASPHSTNKSSCLKISLLPHKHTVSGGVVFPQIQKIGANPDFMRALSTLSNLRGKHLDSKKKQYLFVNISQYKIIVGRDSTTSRNLVH